jgi:catechol 2,3-dioxygenase-like lactoylglutathione lyase family enzyme
MIRITEVAYTGYPVTDMPRARAFYEGVLGLVPAAAWEKEGRFWIEYELGPTALAITNLSPEWKPASEDGPVVALEVADFDAAVAALREARVRFTVEPMDSGACHMAVVADPDGNSVAIHQRNKT